MLECTYCYAVVKKDKKIPKMVFPSPNKSFKEIKKNMKKMQNDVWTSKTIYRRILELCQYFNWTLYQLSDASGVPIATLYTYRRRSSIPKVETLLAICDAFGISLAKFFSVESNDAEELYVTLCNLSPTSRRLLKEVAKRMKE